MKIISCQQGSTEWMLARCGVVTASEIDALISPEWKIRTGKGVKTYLHEKLAERIMGYQDNGSGTWAMEQGQIIEKIALPWYSFQHDIAVTRVGFCLGDDPRIGCSPDGLLGDDGGIEVKAPQPANHLAYLLGGEVPEQYRAQVQMSLYVTRRKYWKFLSYSPYLPPFLVHVEPIPEAQEAIHKAVTIFCSALDAATERVRGMMENEHQLKP